MNCMADFFFPGQYATCRIVTQTSVKQHTPNNQPRKYNLAIYSVTCDYYSCKAQYEKTTDEDVQRDTFL